MLFFQVYLVEVLISKKEKKFMSEFKTSEGVGKIKEFDIQVPTLKSVDICNCCFSCTIKWKALKVQVFLPLNVVWNL